MSSFKINSHILTANEHPDIRLGMEVLSSPRPYTLEFYSGDGAGKRLADKIAVQKDALILIDENIFDLYLSKYTSIATVPTKRIKAVEETKNIETVLDVIDFLELNGATRTSMIFVVGGGILQDVGAFASYMYKRGVPWTFVPTTLLAQGDSSVGGKTALNHKYTKNLLALFSAPRKIITDTGFLFTLPKDDWYSGVGEIFRLCITGGDKFVDVFEREITNFISGDIEATTRLIAVSLSAKKAVVEADEFEIDLRRSMNYGHSFGHALEALTQYSIPHGVGVSIGILVENEIAYTRGMLSEIERNRLLPLGKRIIPEKFVAIFKDTNLDGVIDLLKRDKKTEGTILKLATLQSIGDMRFIDFPLNAQGEKELRTAVATVLAYLED